MLMEVYELSTSEEARAVSELGVDHQLDLACAHEGVAEYLLLASHEPGDHQVGVLGRTHDWSISRRIVGTGRTSAMLAGGIGLDNVAAVISASVLQALVPRPRRI